MALQHFVTAKLQSAHDNNNNKLAPYRTDGRLFTSDVSPTSKSCDTKTRPNVKNQAQSN